MPGGRPFDTTPLIDRFHSNIMIEQNPAVSETLGPCWLWLGSKGVNGYGMIAKKRWGFNYVHVWSYNYHKGDLPPGEEVRHRCDQRPCCNPAHLESGTRAQNVHDAVIRNPTAFNRRLTDNNIKEIRANVNHESHTDLAKRYGVVPTVIGNIMSRRTYTHISE